MTHNASRMAGMEDPAQGLGEVIRGVDDTRDVAHDNVASLLPVLNGKVLDINVTRTFGRVGTRALIILIADMLSS